MSELTVDLLVANILNSMSQNLDDEQLQQLKDQLYIQLHDVDLIPKRYDIVAQLKDSDIEKLKYFATSLKIANRSEGTIKRYLEAARKLRIFIGKDFADITSVDIKYFIAIEQQNHTWKDTTIQNNIQYLRAFYSFLKREEMIEKILWIRSSRLSWNRQLRRLLTPAKWNCYGLRVEVKPEKQHLLNFSMLPE